NINFYIKQYLYSPSNVGNLLGIITEKIFYNKLNILPFDSAFHLAGIIIGTLTAIVVFLFALEAAGVTTAIFSLVPFLLFPRIIGHIHNNIKDVSVMFGFVIVLFSVYKLTTKKNSTWLYISAAALAIALNTKVFAFFLIIIIALWIGLTKRDLIKKSFKSKNKNEIVKTILITIIIFFVTIIIFNPGYWKDPINVYNTFFMLNNFNHGISSNPNPEPVMFFGMIHNQENLPRYYYVATLLMTTPLLILILSIIGIKEIFRSDYVKLLVIWIVLPLLIYQLKGLSMYNVTRHILYIIPAICMLAGVGTKILIEKIKKIKIKKPYKKILSISLIITITVLYLLILKEIIVYHPYQTTYFNEITGGIQGVENKLDIEYYGNSYKEGVLWLNKILDNKSIVIDPMGNTNGHRITKFYINKNIIISDIQKITADNINNENNQYIIYMTHKPYYDTLINYVEKEEVPIHEIKVKNEPIFKIFKLNK
ncbi:MAG: glycosyltransferase family 39 protein, partial [Nanoarchaeota archaeon]|nr:glycosyltransferase family 39 protein [Nanoarchaeota archaeon]